MGEAVPFRETRGYVQGVVRNTCNNRRLYDEQGVFRPEVGAERLDGRAAQGKNVLPASRSQTMKGRMMFRVERGRKHLDSSPQLRRGRAPATAILFALMSGALILVSPDTNAQRKGATRAKASAPQTAAAKSSPKTITVKTEPKAAIWLDELRRGTTDDAGQLVIKNVPAGRRALRVRARGFRERTLALAATQRGEVEVRLTPTHHEARYAFRPGPKKRARRLKKP